MKGVYIHIPFCRKACRYCDFCFTVSLQYIEDYLVSLRSEIEQRAVNERENIISVYFGGGTPSILSIDQVKTFMDFLHTRFQIPGDAEITFEANPDDLSLKYLHGLKEAGINRLSVGTQSFREKDLLLMNRSHTSEQTGEAIHNAQIAGFDNINLDLIYGLPDLSMQAWQENLEKTFSLPVQHLSAYHLTYEVDTIFDKWLKEGRIHAIEEEESIRQYLYLHEFSESRGFDHYEVSNFSIKGYRSRHNGIYWSGEHYAGFGASAHSFNRMERMWNLDAVKRYIQAVNEGKDFYKKESLTETERYHDYLVTRLRTKEGISLEEARRIFNDRQLKYLREKIEILVGQDNEEVKYDGKVFRVTPKGWLRLDTITRALMID